MNKAYLLLIGALVIVVLGVGALAFYRSTASLNTPTSLSYTPSQTTPSQPSQPSNNATTPAVNPSQNQITLTVSSPTNGQTVSTPSVTVTGKTVPNADVAINDKDLKADASGNFSTTLTLEEGDNDVFVTASDVTGQSSEWDATVTYTLTQ